MYPSLFEVSQWCDADLQGRKKITYISRFGERSGSRRIERNVSYLIPKSSYHTCSSLSEVRLCYFIELPSSMMDYADLCFFLKDIIQKVGVGYRIILTQKESPYKSAEGFSSELLLGLEGLELNKQVINGFVSHKKEVGKIGITKLKSFHRLCSLVMAEKDKEYPLVCWGVSSEEVAARSLASRQKIGLKQATIKTFRGESRNRPTAIPAISSYVEEAPKLGQPDPNNIGVSSNLLPEGGPHGSNLPPEGGPHGSDEFWVWWEKRKEMLREHRRNRRGPMDDWAFF
jgi:hypothetical protein